MSVRRKNDWNIWTEIKKQTGERLDQFLEKRIKENYYLDGNIRGGNIVKKRMDFKIFNLWLSKSI